MKTLIIHPSMHTHNSEPQPLLLVSFAGGISSINTFTRVATPILIATGLDIIDYSYEKRVSYLAQFLPGSTILLAVVPTFRWSIMWTIVVV